MSIPEYSTRLTAWLRVITVEGRVDVGMSHCAWYVQPWGSAYWMLTSSPASINCIVPLYGEVHTQSFEDGLVERNRKRHSFLSKCEIVRVVEENRDAIMQETRAWGPEGHAEGGRQ